MMKKLIYIILIILLSSCVRKSLYLRDVLPHDKCRISTLINIDATLQISTNINTDIKNNLLYAWNDSIYGPLGYTIPKSIKGLFFMVDGYNKRSLLYEEEFIVGEPKTTMIKTHTYYDILFHSNTLSTGYKFEVNYPYYISAPLTTTRSSYNFEEDFELCPQVEEQYAVVKNNLYIDPEKDNVTKKNENGVWVYYYNIDVKLIPVTYIYIVQLKIIDDDKDYPMDVDSCLTMIMSGVAKEKELFTLKTTDKRCILESKNIKPLQIKENNYIFVERFLTYGLVNDYKSSWGYGNLTYELGIDLHLSTGEIKTGKINISNLLYEKPTGGVITIELKNSDIHRKSDIDESGGFSVDVQPWSEEINVEIAI